VVDLTIRSEHSIDKSVDEWIVQVKHSRHHINATTYEQDDDQSFEPIKFQFSHQCHRIPRFDSKSTFAPAHPSQIPTPSGNRLFVAPQSTVEQTQAQATRDRDYPRLSPGIVGFPYTHYALTCETYLQYDTALPRQIAKYRGWIRVNPIEEASLFAYSGLSLLSALSKNVPSLIY
jgi:hypothetical protein